MLNFFNGLPSPAKLLLGFFVAGLILSGLLNIGDLISFKNTQNDSLIEVQLVIQTEENQPIQDASIQFISKGSPTTKYTTRSGYAEIEIPARESVEINIAKEGYETLVEIINLQVDPDTNKKFKLKSVNLSSKGIDYQYYTAQNEIFPLSLSLLSPDLKIPMIEKVLEYMEIDKLPLIDRNAVFDNIEKFKTESGNKGTIQEIISNAEADGVSDTAIGVSDTNQVDSTFVLRGEEREIRQDTLNLSEKQGEDDFCTFAYAPLVSSFQTVDNNSEYTAFIRPEYASDYGDIIQYPKLSDLSKYGQKEDGCIKKFRDLWIRKIIEENPNISGFLGFDYNFIFDLEKHPETCAGSWRLKRISPSPYVKFIDIINNNSNPIRIESINYQSIDNNPYKLTEADQRSILFQSSSNLTKNLNISLRPENHLLIPIEFGFNTEPIKKTYQLYSDIDKSKILSFEEIYVRKPLSRSERERVRKATWTQVNKINMTPISLSEEFINNASSREELFNSIPRRFAVGSILNVTSIKINGQNININPPSDEPTVYISTVFIAGSCPYLVAYDPQQDSWLELGTILYARRNKSLQQEELHNLGNSVSKIRIEEREPEITYIDALSIVYTEPDEEEIQEVIYPMAELQKVDEDYFLLHQGEVLEIDLEQFVPASASDIKLKINGYYEVLQGEPSYNSAM